MIQEKNGLQIIGQYYHNIGQNIFQVTGGSMIVNENGDDGGRRGWGWDLVKYKNQDISQQQNKDEKNQGYGSTCSIISNNNNHNNRQNIIDISMRDTLITQKERNRGWDGGGWRDNKNSDMQNYGQERGSNSIGQRGEQYAIYNEYIIPFNELHCRQNEGRWSQEEHKRNFVNKKFRYLNKQHTGNGYLNQGYNFNGYLDSGLNYKDGQYGKNNKDNNFDGGDCFGIEGEEKNNNDEREKDNRCLGMEQRLVIKMEVEKHKNYFTAVDWQKLLFIIHEIILENIHGVGHLWQFINNFKGKKRFRKGKRVFEILSVLGMEPIFDKLIAEEAAYKLKQKQKQSKIRTSIFNLVHRIE